MLENKIGTGKKYVCTVEDGTFVFKEDAMPEEPETSEQSE